MVRRGVNRSAESWHLRSVHRFGLQLCERVALGETANEPSDTFRSQLTELVAPPNSGHFGRYELSAGTSRVRANGRV